LWADRKLLLSADREKDWKNLKWVVLS
jgi:hypothetical protein